mmetsp:Transcript_6426/g.13806  ORF Transcript_6426/g.13806 Transcript_6426/m.13806 type:complete len:89 (+) Transcript_6426:195-461(+)
MALGGGRSRPPHHHHHHHGSLALVLESELAAAFTKQLGTKTHMPPEMSSHTLQTIQLTMNADVYAAGLILWQAMTGEVHLRGFRLRRL